MRVRRSIMFVYGKSERSPPDLLPLSFVYPLESVSSQRLREKRSIRRLLSCIVIPPPPQQGFSSHQMIFVKHFPFFCCLPSPGGEEVFNRKQRKKTGRDRMSRSRAKVHFPSFSGYPSVHFIVVVVPIPAVSTVSVQGFRFREIQRQK